MKLQLKEEPKEWLKFTAVMALAAGIVASLLFQRRVVSRDVLFGIGEALLLILLICALRPRWFRGFYRVGMTVSWHTGQVIGRLLLTAFFLVAVTPLGLLLRLMGKDLLALRRDPSAKSYWRAAKTRDRFDQQF